MSDLDFTGKRVVVTGGASGVGAALLDLLAELGAPHVTVLDRNEPAGPHAVFIRTDLSSPSDIDAAAAAIAGPVDALFNNAGVADTSPRDIVLKVNALAPIRLTEALFDKLAPSSAVVTTASIAGMNWSKRIADHLELLALDGWDAMYAWLDGRELGVDTYSFTKEVMQVWTMRAARVLYTRGIRINSVCPAPIDTPLLADFRKTMSDFAIDFSISNAGGRAVSAREVAAALAWLASPASAYVAGVNLNIDAGFVAGMTTGQVKFGRG